MVNKIFSATTGLVFVQEDSQIQVYRAEVTVESGKYVDRGKVYQFTIKCPSTELAKRIVDAVHYGGN